MKKISFILSLIFTQGVSPVKAQCAYSLIPHDYYVTDTSDFTSGSIRQQILSANFDGTGGRIIDSTGISNPTFYLQAPLPIVTVDSLLIFWYCCFTIDGGFAAYDPVLTFSASASHSCSTGGIIFRNFLPTIFTVTNVNDNGDGSLRDAINKSNTSDSKDNISFNIAGIAPHAIYVPQSIDILNPVTIDGTTQPPHGYTGTAPKIELFTTNAYSTVLNVGSGSFDVYGLYIHSAGDAIFLGNVSNVNIGSILKPNVINKIYNEGIDLYFGCFNVNIVGNTLGIDTLTGKDNAGIRVRQSNNIFIADNVIGGNYLAIDVDAADSITIVRNHIGTNTNETDSIPNYYSIYVRSNSSDIQIGGLTPADKNIIAFTEHLLGLQGTGIIINDTCINVSILGNSIYKNQLSGIFLESNTNDSILAPVFTITNYDTIAGIARPYSRIELFYNIDPPNKPQGKTFIDAISADSIGNWQYISSIANPCSITATQTDSQNTSAFSFLAGITVHLMSDTSLCFGSSISLDADLGFDSYVWNTGDSTQTISVDSSGTYIVQTISSGSHCPSSDTVNITVNAIPFVTIGNDSLICNTQTILLDAGTGFLNYQWQDSSNAQTFLAADSTGGQDTTLFFVIVTDSNYCSTTDSITIIFDECLAISDYSNSNFIYISPNPFHSSSLLQVSSEFENARMKIYNSLGSIISEERISNQKTIVMNRNAFRIGIYFLHLINDKGETTTSKFVVD
ncbi:MAG: T9SS type A sorting domain-containing protein [Bacteroidota bacterium]